MKDSCTSLYQCDTQVSTGRKNTSILPALSPTSPSPQLRLNFIQHTDYAKAPQQAEAVTGTPDVRQLFGAKNYVSQPHTPWL